MVDYNENVYARRGGLEEKSHIPAMPFWVAIIRVVQLVFTFVVMILCAYSSSVLGAGSFSGYGLGFYIFVWTLIFLAYIFVTPLWFPRYYNVWIQLIFEIKCLIFWLSTFALLSEEAAAWGALYFEENLIANNSGGNIVTNIWSQGNAAIGATKAAASFGVFTWLSFVVTLAAFGIAFHRHRLAGNPTGFRDMYSRTVKPGDVEAAAKARSAQAVNNRPVELTDVAR